MIPLRPGMGIASCARHLTTVAAVCTFYLRKTYRLVTQRAAEPQRVMPRDDLLISLNEREFIVKALQEVPVG